MQRTISALALALLATVVVGGCQRPIAGPVSQPPAADTGVQAAERASARVSTQQANQTEGAPKASPTEGPPRASVEPVYSVVSPLGDPTARMITMAPRLDTLAGKTVCLVWNHAFKADITLPAIEESLKKKYPDIRIVPYSEIDAAIRAAGPEDVAAEAAALQAVLKQKGCNAVISGNGG